MVQEIGEHKTTALAKYEAITSLTTEQARDIVNTIWPSAEKASPAEVYKAVQICVQYGLNPLMRHVYLIPFWDKEKRVSTYVTVLGIGANRLIASRKHAYSYIYDTPRLMSDDEQVKAFGEIDANLMRAVTILKDAKTGASARGYGSWKRDVDPKGIDKGNSKANMAMIRSERQALDRLYPADLPCNVEVIDEQYQGSVTVEQPTEAPPPTTEGEIVTGSAVDKEPEKPAQSKVEIDLAKLEFANSLEFYAACEKHCKLDKAHVNPEIAMFDLSIPGQRAKAWQTILAVYGKKEK